MPPRVGRRLLLACAPTPVIVVSNPESSKLLAAGSGAVPAQLAHAASCRDETTRPPNLLTFREALGGNWGDSAVHGWVNSGKDG